MQHYMLCTVDCWIIFEKGVSMEAFHVVECLLLSPVHESMLSETDCDDRSPPAALLQSLDLLDCHGMWEEE